MAGFEEHQEAFRNAGVRLAVLSADGEAGARKMKDEEGLSFPVLYGLDVDEMHERFGIYIAKGEKTHLQPAQFIVDPGGKIFFASYSSGKVGRLSAEEALEEVPDASTS